jgi:GGDEF domain-containing protein
LSAELDAQLLIDSHTGLVYIDLDDFGRLNQKLGIARADEVLFSIIQSLAAVCKVESFTFHRVLGDQFAIFVNGKRDVLEAARKLTMEIRNLPVTASLGTVRGVGENADVMIRRALRGAELSKRNGKNQITDQTYPGHRTPVPAISAYEFS